MESRSLVTNQCLCAIASPFAPFRRGRLWQLDVVGRGEVTCELDVDDSLFNCLFFTSVSLAHNCHSSLAGFFAAAPRTSKGRNLMSVRLARESQLVGLLVRCVLKILKCSCGRVAARIPPSLPPTPPPPSSSAHRHRLCTSAVNFLQKASQLCLSLECSRRRRSHALINVPACFAALVYSETKVEKAPMDLLSAVNLKLKHRGLCVIAG